MRYQWCVDLSASVMEVTSAMAVSGKSSRDQDRAQRGVSAYDAVTGPDKEDNTTAADIALNAKLRKRLIAYVENSLEVPSSKL